MPLYRALAPVFTDRLIRSGEEFSSDATPGRNWEPLDAEAKAKVAAHKRPPEPASAIADSKPLIAIPADWREGSGQKIIALAVKLGAPAKGTTVQAATDWIEREIANRGHVSDERVREAA